MKKYKFIKVYLFQRKGGNKKVTMYFLSSSSFANCEKLSFLNGSSSFLFVISAVKSVYCSKLIFWKLSNGVLVGVSFLCNATEYNPNYLFLDYLTIIFISASYINNFIVNSLLLLFLYKYFDSIEKMKNIASAIAMSKCILYNYKHDKHQFWIILGSSTLGLVVYTIRYYLQNKKYNLLLTYLFHICITSILYHTSVSAI